MRILVTAFLAAMIVAIAPSPPVVAHHAETAQMVSAAEAGRWTAARDAARATRDPAAAEAYEWLRLRSADADDFRRMSLWVSAHPGWPDAKRIQARGERGVESVSEDEAIRFFDVYPPTTGKGSAIYAIALQRAGRVGEAVKAARQAWLERDLTPSLETRLLRDFPPDLETAPRSTA